MAFLMEKKLEEKGRDLDEAMKAVFESRRTHLRSQDLLELYHDVYAGLVDQILQALVLNDTALPELDLGQASGGSGCARYLP